MAKKTPQNRYGINIGDIFVEHHTSEDNESCYFYQVVALRGELTVVVRRIDSKIIAFDGRYESVVPIPDDWITDEEFVRRVHNDRRKPDIVITDCGWCSDHAYLPDKKDEMYLEWSGEPDYPYMLCKGSPEIASQLDLKNGSGIYMAEGFKHGEKVYDKKALIRYPDGSEEETALKELFDKNK